MSAIRAFKDELRANPLRIFRIVFGLHGLFFWSRIIAGYDGLFGVSGIPKSIVALRYNDSIWKMILDLPDICFIASMFLGLIASGAIAFAAGRKITRPAFFLFWFSLMFFFIRHPGVRSVHIDYLGWLALLNAFIPSTDRYVRSEFAWAAWLFFSAGYFFSGWRKWSLDPWVRGYAVEQIVTGPIGRFEFAPLFLPWVAILSPYLTRGVVVLELVAPLLILKRATRFFLWASSVTLHLGILTFMLIPDLTIAILLFHIFLGVTLFRPGIDE